MSNSNRPAVVITDSTLRDGNHAVSHQLRASDIASYCQWAEAAHVPIVEVGHGNGLAASSLQVGLAACSDQMMLETARMHLKTSRLGIHVIPGFATVAKDLKPALDLGVDVVRVASHCTEADITERHIGYCRDQGKTVFGVLMMSHMAEVPVLCEEAKKLEAYGAEAVIIMDSSGTYLPLDVTRRVSALKESIGIGVGFHAHNNLGMAIANSIAAIEAGAVLIDGSIRGFGAGAGNAQLETLVAVLERLGVATGIDLYRVLDAGDFAETLFVKELPVVRSLSIVSGLSGVFSGFSKPVLRIASENGVDPRDVFFELGRRRAVAGQEDLILEVVKEIKSRGNR
uniref:4-hydroxy-2-oxovalerate aldolase n=1 Tax=Spirochaeta aurantia TaxID=147 RepID=HOA_SPIAU|nr:RecName: Full=4-hydroxy-2-oxovalerate aldolase; Short=HOA; AltName: Full=4-hydroxy-2-keto-pentanoic acid aldolase; AltName: Full=4-hydroxy-2-oxopentanoate aldolase [Spirochaeta aurantia]ABH03012.1 MhpE [Spirochaeta aurantia]